MPTINLTAGCLHSCAYCYIRSYRGYPGESTIILYENTLEKLQDELVRRRTKPQAVYFSPSSDLFQPAPEVLELAEAVLKLLFREGVGVAFLTKGHMPDDILRLLTEHAELVRAQVGIISLDEDIVQTFEPYAASPRRRLQQLEVLIAGGVPTEARLDPILPTLTDAPAAADRLFAALAQVGVKRAAAGVLFLRRAILQSLRRNVSDKEMLTSLLDAYRDGQQGLMRGSPLPIQGLPPEVTREIFARMGGAARANGIELRVCACKSSDLARSSCNIAGTWPRRQNSAVQPLLI
jgi:DNA repair photolyase